MKNKIFELFKDFEIFCVGGYVRDMLLGKESNDLDYATDALPEQIESILKKAGYRSHKVGWAFGTIGVIENGYEIHITTYRKAEYYQRDNRKPVVEWGKTITDDLTRRDFTINSLALDKNGEILDLFNGREHLENHILETSINAEEAFSSDPLRMLRAVRFKAQLNFHYSENVKKALETQAFRLMILSKERIQDEFNKILLSDNVKDALYDLYDYKLFNYFLPELTMLANIDQESEFHHKNGLLHTLDVVANSPVNIISRYAALFHDIGKPFTKSIVDNKVHFYKHEDLSAFLAKSILNRMGLPKKWIDDIVFAVKAHMRANLYDGSWSDSAIRRFINEMGNNIDLVLELSKADITSHRAEIINNKLSQLKELKDRINILISFKEVKSPLDGNIIMQEFHLGPCRKISEIKDLLINALIEGKLKLNENKQVYIDYVKNNWKEYVKR